MVRDLDEEMSFLQLKQVAAMRFGYYPLAALYNQELDVLSELKKA